MANTPKSIHVKVDMDTAEVRAAMLEASADAYDQGRLDEIHAQATGEYRQNPYRGDAA